MRKFLIIALGISCGGVLAVLPTPASASTTSTFQATFQSHFGAGVAPLPCEPHYMCSTGTVAGYGAATGKSRITSYTPIPDTDCFSFNTSATITLTDGSGTLALDTSGIRCRVGNSGEAPGSAVSYGNPWSATGIFTITGGTGVFEGASGSGTFLSYFAGDVQIIELSGTITLP
jgi:hypothetical protein